MNGIKNKQDKTAIILLHEIYGVNTFIQKEKEKREAMGFTVFYMNLLEKEPFPYEEAEKAYTYFTSHVGFDAYRKVLAFAEELKKQYTKVVIWGFSVGATLAWRCSDSPYCDGVIGCYGSRIRDYLEITPKCPVLLLFAQKDSFDVDAVVEKLSEKNQVQLKKFPAQHGFMDAYGKSYVPIQAEQAEIMAESFLKGFVTEKNIK